MINKDKFLPLFVSIVVVFFLTMGTTYIAFKDSVEKNQQNFNSKIEDINNNIVSNLRTLEADILGFRTFFHASLSLEADQFRLYASDLLQKNKILKETYYLPIVKDNERPVFVDYMRQKGYPTFKIYERNEANRKVKAGQKFSYYPVKYLEPMEPWTVGLLGYDISSIAVVKDAINKAIDTGKPVSLKTKKLFKNSAVILTSTYAGKQQTPDNIVDRRKAANGIIIFKLNLDDLVDEALSEEDNIAISLKFNNSSNLKTGRVSLENKIVFSDNILKNKEIGKFNQIKMFEFSGSSIEINSLYPFFKGDLITSFLIFSIIGSLIFSFLFILFTYKEINKSEKIKLLVKQKTQELSEKNRDLVSLNNSVTAMLESLGPALLFFDINGVCSDTSSDSCITLLETEPAGRNIANILKLDKTKKDKFLSLIAFAFSNKSAMGFEDIFGMAPGKYKHSLGKTVHLEYRPIYNIDQELENILVIAIDKTDEEMAKNIIEEKRIYSEKIIRLVHSKDDYTQILQQFHAYFLNDYNEEYKNETSLVSIKQNIHTLKGLVGSFSLYDLLNIIHDIEDRLRIEDADTEKAKVIISDQVTAIKKLFEEEIQFSNDILGYNVLEKGVMLNVSYDHLFEFHNLLLNNNDVEAADNFYNNFLMIPIFDIMEFLDFHLQETAKLVDKKINPCVFEGENIPFPVRKYDELLFSFVHFIRNAADHGFEPTQIRLDKQKPEAGTLRISVSIVEKEGQDWLNINFSDDGRGIDVGVIKEKLKSKGIDTDLMSDEDVMLTIFEDSMSSKQEVSTLSGRGVGLSAIKQKVEEQDGLIKVSSSLGQGTSFQVSFPFLQL